MLLRQACLTNVLGVWIALGLAASASAQYQPPPVPQRRPPYSPYLNLTRPGSLVNNYYGLVRPEIDFRNSIAGLQQQTGALNQALTNPNVAETPFPTTGHPATFQNYGHYFSLRGRSPIAGAGSYGSGARPTGAAPQAGSRPVGQAAASPRR